MIMVYFASEWEFWVKFKHPGRDLRNSLSKDLTSLIWLTSFPTLQKGKLTYLPKAPRKLPSMLLL